jgi:hypothetical protein
MKSEKISSVDEERSKKFIAPLVFENPCEHIVPFGPCLAEITVYKHKLASELATVLGFETETHKLLLVTPIEANGEKIDKFEPMVLELNFGSKKLFSSGTYMHCLKCAKFIDDEMIKCSPRFVCCIEKDFLINAMKSYIDTIQFFGPRKCNCQSYAYYILSSFGVPDKALLNAKVVETDSGFIRSAVIQLATFIEYDRPLIKGDINQHQVAGKKRPVKSLPIPTFLAQFEFDEYNDKVGKNYLKMLIGFVISTNFLIILIGICIYWFFLR